MACCLRYVTITKHSNLNLIDRHQFPWLTVTISRLVLAIKWNVLVLKPHLLFAAKQQRCMILFVLGRHLTSCTRSCLSLLEEESRSIIVTSFPVAPFSNSKAFRAVSCQRFAPSLSEFVSFFGGCDKCIIMTNKVVLKSFHLIGFPRMLF